MARTKKSQSTKELIEKKENQKALLAAVAKSKWSYEQILEFINSDPSESGEF